MIAQGAKDLTGPLPGEHPRRGGCHYTVVLRCCAEPTRKVAGEALEGIGAMRGKSRKEGAFVQDFKTVQG